MVRMARFSSLIMLICVLAACVLPVQAASTRVPYGSFLTRPVSSAADFAQLLRQDKVVAQRFADHYGMNNDALADYFEKYGKVVTISKSGSYVEYFIDRYGRVQKHHKLLRPGTKILAVKGTPVLDLRCGNPMNKALPKIVEKVDPIVQEEIQAPAPAPAPEVLQEPTPAPQPVVQVLAEKPLEYPTPVAVTSAPRASELVWLLPGGLVGLGTLSGGSDNPGPPPIPETSALLLGVGGTGFVLTFYRRLRRNR